jgi:hypothetical protein
LMPVAADMVYALSLRLKYEWLRLCDGNRILLLGDVPYRSSARV